MRSDELDDFPLRSIKVQVPALSMWPLELRFSPGVNVLYGLNGVGKSRLLDALPEATFHFAVPLNPEEAPADSEDDPTLSERLWGRYGGRWSIGHESELKSPVDLIWGLSPLLHTHPNHLQELGWFNESPILNRYPTAIGTRAGVFTDWLKRLAFWFGRFAEIHAEHEAPVADAIERILRDGHLELRRLRTEPASTENNGVFATSWTVLINADVTPDQQELDRYLTVAAQRCVEDLDLDHLVGLTGDELDDEITQLLLDLDVPEAYLMHEAVYGVVDEAIRSQIDPDPRQRQPAHHFRGRVPIASRDMTFQNWSPVAFIGASLGDVNEWTLEVLIDVVAQQIYDEAVGKRLRGGSSAESDRYRRTGGPKRLTGRSYELDAEEWIFGDDPNALALNPDAIAQVDEMATEATREFQSLLLGAGDLRLRFTNPREWVSGSRLVWECQDTGGTWVALNQLSDTQRRLAELAIQITFLANDAGVPILMLDEPERGLHRLAELHLRHGLSDLARRFPNLVVLVASHSPAFLRPDLAQLHHVTRTSSGDLRVASLDRLDLADVDTLGVTPTDLLQLTRIVVLVEGAHDEWVLNALFGSEFQRMGVRVMSMRGANKLIAAAEGQLLFDYTSAHLVVMLDNISNEKASARWNEAQVQHADGADLATIEKTLRTLLPNKKHSDSTLDRSTEVAALKDFCLAAIKNNRQDRITFSTLGLGDIEFYLDPKHFLTGLSRNDQVPTWKALLAEHKEAKKQPGTKNFKTWLSDSGRAKWNQARWERAVAALDEIPEDLAEVFRTIERLHLMLR